MIAGIGIDVVGGVNGLLCVMSTILNSMFCRYFVLSSAATMEAGEDQNSGSANGNTQSGGNSRPPQIAHMSLYERQAVQVRTTSV